MDTQQLAAMCFAEVETKTRASGERFYTIRYDSLPFDLQSIVRDIHGDMLPNDWIYSVVVEGLELIQDRDDWEDALSELEPDIYTADLMSWLNFPDFRERANEALREIGAESIEDAAMYAQVQLKHEIISELYSALEDVAEDWEDEDAA